MSIRWRLTILGLQLLVLGSATSLVTGEPVTRETWFLAGLLAVIVNPQLLEPWYARPQDVLANALVAGFLIWTTPRDGPVGSGWLLLGVSVAVLGGVALLGLVLGAGRERGAGVALGRSATLLSRHATALGIYSGVFWLSALDYRPELGRDFWILAVAWLLIVVVGRLNWQTLWSAMTGRQPPCTPEGMIGPATLLVASSSLPEPGTRVSLRSPTGDSVQGVILTRIRRSADVWGQVLVDEPAQCEDLVSRSALMLAVLPAEPDDARILGVVDVGSTDHTLRFRVTRPLSVGEIVAVASEPSEILYQVTGASVEQATTRGGSQLVVRAEAEQLGIYSEAERRLSRHAWVPTPGAAVRPPSGIDQLAGTGSSLLVGTVIGTSVPVELDLARLSEGHAAILGMTRMGKTTLALRLARVLSADHPVVILDGTGQYIRREGLDPYEESHDTRESGLSVCEPPDRATPADFAYQFLSRVAATARAEYESNMTRQRVVLVEEAHQFVPEPAGLGFQSPGRESAMKFGTLMMQISKYGICVILISQRTAVVGKSALSQCENLIAFKNVDQTGLDYLEAVLGSGARAILPTLRQGEALAFGPAVSSDVAVSVRVSR